jgi:hypothetical protein
MERVLSGSSLTTIRNTAAVQVPLFSTSVGTPYSARNAAELFGDVVSELLTKAICWDGVIEGFVDDVQKDSSSNVSLFCFGNSIPMRDLTTALSKAIPEMKISRHDLITWVLADDDVDATPRGPAQSKLAIVGMSCRLPGGATVSACFDLIKAQSCLLTTMITLQNTEEFWNIMEQGLDVSRQIPADRFDVDTHYDPTGKQLNKSMTEFGCFIDEPGMYVRPRSAVL